MTKRQLLRVEFASIVVLMGAAAGSSTIKARKSFRLTASWLLLALPLSGITGLIWYATHRVSRPDITIFEAAAKGDYRSVRDHILTGTSVNEISEDGHTPLYYAVLSKKDDVTELLLKNGARVEFEAPDTPTPLYAAAGEGNANIVKQLIAAGADPIKESTHGITPLFAAANAGNPEVVKILLDAGADPNAIDANSGSTPLCNAAIKGNEQCIDLLLDRGAKINQPGPQGQTPIFYALTNFRPSLIQHLIDRGADVDIENSNRVKALSRALEIRAPEELVWLLFNHMHSYADLDWQSRSPLHYAIANNGSSKLVQALIDKGCDVNQIDIQRSTPMALALIRNDTTIQNMLSDAGAHITLAMLIRQALRPNTKPRAGGFIGVS